MNVALAHFPDMDATRNPIVQLTDTNEAMADSRDVAAYFNRMHRDVMRAIENVLPLDPDFSARNFTHTPYVEPQNGQTYYCYMMTQAGFTMTVMSFTGAAAYRFKVKYINAFEAMQAELARRSPKPEFNLPASFAEALQLAADQARQIDRQKSEIAAMAPKSEAYDRFINADGLIGLQDAGRALNCRPNLFIQSLIPRYLFRDGSRLIAKQTHVIAGLFENKPFTAPNGKNLMQAMMTPRGVDYFSTRVPPEIKSIQQPAPAPSAPAMITH